MYCANVHPGESLEALEAQVEGSVTLVRQLRGLKRMGSGLWLSGEVARRLSGDSGEIERFRDFLDSSGIDLFTLNGFPFGNFHNDVVKERVYQPDWTCVERFDYTEALAEILAVTLPDGDYHGSISSLPLGFAPGWTSRHQEQALASLCRMARRLSEIESDSGRRIILCLEMEPGCVLERTEQLLALFDRELPQAAHRLGINESLVRRYLGACLDVCHQAVMFERPGEVMKELQDHGITVGKIQISSALEITQPANPLGRADLSRYNEPRYLHQVRMKHSGGAVFGMQDLGDALKAPGMPADRAWRVHFHVPIQADKLDSPWLGTTRAAILDVLDFLKSFTGPAPHLEVETYTWNVLPTAIRPAGQTELCEGITRELVWLEDQMERRDLLMADRTSM